MLRNTITVKKRTIETVMKAMLQMDDFDGPDSDVFSSSGLASGSLTFGVLAAGAAVFPAAAVGRGAAGVGVLAGVAAGTGVGTGASGIGKMNTPWPNRMIWGVTRTEECRKQFSDTQLY